MTEPFFSPLDEQFMHLALAMGRRGQGRTWPNPAVGCIVVQGRGDDAVIVGRGWTAPGGRPHAEPQALARAGEAARDASLYVTLEPCSHKGHSAPCADAIIAAGIKRVFGALEDPDPRVAGQGYARLREAGIDVHTGLCADRARLDLAGHVSRVTRQRPHVQLKLAVSANGKIAGPGGKALWITGDLARRTGHLMRARSDAIMVGAGTVRADNPDLTCRLPGLAKRSPVRIVMTGRQQLPPQTRLLDSVTHPVWLLGSRQPPRPDTLNSAVTFLPLPAVLGKVDLTAAMKELARRGITRLLVEGGARLAAAMLERDLVDEVALFQAPVKVDTDGLDALHGLPLEYITRSPRFVCKSERRIGEDTLFTYIRTT